MGVLNNFNLSGSGSNSLTQQLINQNPNILLNNSPANYSANNELLTSILNNSPNTLLSGTGANSLLGSVEQFAQGAQSWLNSYEVNNNLPITYPSSSSSSSIGSDVSGVLSGLAQLVNGVGGVMAMKNGVATAFAPPYENGQATTYSRTTGQSVNPITGKPIPQSQFPISSVLLIGGGILAVILLTQML